MIKKRNKKMKSSHQFAEMLLIAACADVLEDYDKDQLDKEIIKNINFLYRNNEDYDFQKNPMDISADWLRMSGFLGKVFWIRAAEKLSKEFDILYKKSRNSDYAIASAMLYPCKSTYKKTYTQLNKLRPKITYLEGLK